MVLEELASYLKLSRASLYKMAQRGKIPAVKVGRGWRFDQAKIDAWLSQGQATHGAEFPWSDCLDAFLKAIQKKFEKRFSSLWMYGSWARGEARPDSDVDLLVVLDPIQNYSRDLNDLISLAYQSTFGRNRSIVFSITLVGQGDFLNSMEPLLLNVRREGRKAA